MLEGNFLLLEICCWYVHQQYVSFFFFYCKFSNLINRLITFHLWFKFTVILRHTCVKQMPLIKINFEKNLVYVFFYCCYCCMGLLDNRLYLLLLLLLLKRRWQRSNGTITQYVNKYRIKKNIYMKKKTKIIRLF